MLRSMYMTATNMVVQRRKMDVVTNNISNLETTGFKGETLVSRSFPEMLLRNTDDPAIIRYSPEIGGMNTGVHIDEVITSFDQGSPEETGRTTDFALLGEGYFVLNTPAGERYTRDGHFFFNNDGLLVNSDGYAVMGVNGEIRVTDDDVSVDTDGRIFSQGVQVAQLRLVAFADEGGLRKAGYNMFTNFTNQPVLAADNVQVKQGYLEGSNVQISSEIIDMMGIYRSYETSQRIMQMLDNSLQKTVNEVGRV